MRSKEGRRLETLQKTSRNARDTPVCSMKGVGNVGRRVHKASARQPAMQHINDRFTERGECPWDEPERGAAWQTRNSWISYPSTFHRRSLRNSQWSDSSSLERSTTGLSTTLSSRQSSNTLIGKRTAGSSQEKRAVSTHSPCVCGEDSHVLPDGSDWAPFYTLTPLTVPRTFTEAFQFVTWFESTGLPNAILDSLSATATGAGGVSH